MSEKIEILTASRSDLNEVSILWSDMVREENGPAANPDREAWLKVISSQPDFPIFTMLVARDRDRIVGFITGAIEYNPCNSKIHGTAQTIYVVPEHRNGSAGPRLYRELARQFKKAGAEVIQFFCRPGMLKFWHKKGFSPYQVLMAKPLG